MKFSEGSFKLTNKSDSTDAAQMEAAVAKAKTAHIIGGCLYLLFGLILIADKANATFPAALAIAAGVAATVGFFYILVVMSTYHRVYNAKPDEYQAEVLKNGKSQGYNFLTAALILLAAFYETASRTSVPGLLFVILGVATLISQLSTRYDPKTAAE